MRERRPLTIADYYPPGMSECDSIGMGGGCGPDCRVYLRGECEHEESMREKARDGEQLLLFETRVDI